jgi:hypothetical protein
MKLKKENEKLYYLEQGKVVFTPEYHMARGYCCGNKCRHCPYIPEYIKGNTKIKQKENGNS